MNDQSRRLPKVRAMVVGMALIGVGTVSAVWTAPAASAQPLDNCYQTVTAPSNTDATLSRQGNCTGSARAIAACRPGANRSGYYAYGGWLSPYGTSYASCNMTQPWSQYGYQYGNGVIVWTGP